MKMNKDYGTLEKNVPIGMEDSNSKGRVKFLKLFPEVGDCRWIEETENPVVRDKSGMVKSKARHSVNSIRVKMYKYDLSPKIKTYYKDDGSISGYRIWRTK